MAQLLLARLPLTSSLKATDSWIAAWSVFFFHGAEPIVVNGVITPIHGRKEMGKWGDFQWLITMVIISPLRIGLFPSEQSKASTPKVMSHLRSVFLSLSSPVWCVRSRLSTLKIKKLNQTTWEPNRIVSVPYYHRSWELCGEILDSTQPLWNSQIKVKAQVLFRPMMV